MRAIFLIFVLLIARCETNVCKDKGGEATIEMIKYNNILKSEDCNVSRVNIYFSIVNNSCDTFVLNRKPRQFLCYTLKLEPKIFIINRKSKDSLILGLPHEVRIPPNSTSKVETLVLHRSFGGSLNEMRSSINSVLGSDYEVQYLNSLAHIRSVKSNLKEIFLLDDLEVNESDSKNMNRSYTLTIETLNKLDSNLKELDK